MDMRHLFLLLSTLLAFPTDVSASEGQLQETFDCVANGLTYDLSDLICSVAKCIDISTDSGMMQMNEDPNCSCDMLVDVCTSASSLLAWIAPDLTGLCVIISQCCAEQSSNDSFNKCWHTEGTSGVNEFTKRLNGEVSGILPCFNSGLDIGTCCGTAYDPMSRKVCDVVNCVDVSASPGAFKCLASITLDSLIDSTRTFAANAANSASDYLEIAVQNSPFPIPLLQSSG
ncbi:hypothetical protein HJC23_004599 [Cyclotella cryptica]|uniref:Uncharacterized protein n=1 Tax=Cyclotella cryptica TaxID=29204 RepID=A0ABD3QG91_9STRA